MSFRRRLDDKRRVDWKIIQMNTGIDVIVMSWHYANFVHLSMPPAGERRPSRQQFLKVKPKSYSPLVKRSFRSARGSSKNCKLLTEIFHRCEPKACRPCVFKHASLSFKKSQMVDLTPMKRWSSWMAAGWGVRPSIRLMTRVTQPLCSVPDFCPPNQLYQRAKVLAV